MDEELYSEIEDIKSILDSKKDIDFFLDRIKTLERINFNVSQALYKALRPDKIMRDFGKRLEALEKEIKEIKDAQVRG